MVRNLLKTVLAYATAVALCCGIMSYLLLREAELRRPLNYSGDALLIQAWVKGLLDNGWYLHDRFTGVPDTWHMEDFPMSESLHFFIMKVIGLFTHDHFKVRFFTRICG